MPIERKPLFRPDVMHQHLVAFQLPEYIVTIRPSLTHWADLIASGRADKLNEKELLPDFLTDFFVDLLGYTRPADGGQRYTLSREKHVQVDGKYADAVLGEFNGRERPVVAVEGKGTRDPLDRPFAGRKMSAVDQCYRYAINLPCDWIIVTSMRQVRLYYKGADQLTYERFDVEALADNENLLRQFVFLLGAVRVVPADGRSHLYDLLAESEKVGRELTKKFYVQYGDMRQDAFARLCQDNPQVPPKIVLADTQKLLDRVLFCAFAEDRGLLPVDTIQKAYEHRDPYHPRPIYDNFRGLFQAINGGNAALGIHAYNGGLFAEDASLDHLQVSDDVCAYFRDLGGYDYRPPHQAAIETGGDRIIDVDILGHIFEQSITDLERLRNELDGLVEPVGPDKHKTRRKKEGAFYTPSFITRYIVEQALGGVLKDRFERLRQKHQDDARGTARSALADPTVYTLETLKKPERAALVDFWDAWQEELVGIRLLDPACGSGAFLIQAFDQLYAEYQSSNGRLTELRGARPLLDLDKRILENNLYGVDLNEEAIEICRLSLWIKTAHRGKPLTSLDHSIRVGNSVVNDPQVHTQAFDWQTAFPEVFKTGGFDVVVGNPPYIRHEWLKAYKGHWQVRFPEVFAGTADIYVYFYALGIQLLRRGGRLAFISSNAFARSGYGTPLRQHALMFMEQFIDLGDTQIFTDAKDVYPAIVVLRKPLAESPEPGRSVRTVRFRRNDALDDMAEMVRRSGWDVPAARLNPEGWQFDAPAIIIIREKMLRSGQGLGEYVADRILLGLKTGLNEAFVIDDATRDRLVSAHRKSAEVIKPFAGGQDLRRWFREDSGRWLILFPNGVSVSRCGSDDESVATNWLRKEYPAIADHLFQFEAAARRRGDKGQFWWELRPCDYVDAFERPKIVYPDIAKSNRFHMDVGGLYSANTTYFLPGEDWFLLGILNSDAIWFALAGISIPFGERAGEFRYRLFTQYVEKLPIPDATEADRQPIAALARSCTEVGTARYELQTKVQRRLLQALGHDMSGAPLGQLNQKAQEWWSLSLNELGQALKTSFKLSASPFKNPRVADEWEPYLAEHRREVECLTRALADAEGELNDRVYRLFQLTPDEIKLLQREVEH